MKLAFLAFLFFTSQAASCGPLGDRLSLDVRADHAATFEGYAQVRQDTIRGDHLELGDDLGVTQWFSASFEAAFQFDARHGVRAGFFWHQFRGGTTYDRLVRYNGAFYGAGTSVDFGPTQWWRVELWYEFTPYRSQSFMITLGSGFLLDDLTVFTKPDRELLGAKQEHKEDFGEHRLPLPAVGARVEYQPVERLRLAAQSRFSHVRDLPTPYVEGTRIYKTATYLDVSAELSYQIGEVEFGAALRYRAYHVDDQCELGGDEFSVRGLLAQAFIRVWL